MAAPKGNQFWKLRSKHGKDKLFTTPALLWEAACDYFQSCYDNPIIAEDNKGTRNVNEVRLMRPFTRKGFCIFCDASEHWYENFKLSAPEDYQVIMRKIETIIDNQQYEGAIVGLYNSNLVARMQGLGDSQKVEHSGGITLHFDSDDAKA
jgi:hypothetical protein